MPEDYYGGGGDDAGTSMPSGGADDDKENSPHDTGTTAVVPSELCPGMKVGDEMVVKILSVDDDSYEIGYAPKGGKSKAEGDEAGEGAGDAPPPAEGSMASMY